MGVKGHRLVQVILGVALVALLTGCQVRLSTDVTVKSNGSGTVAQSIGFDAAALARVGDPARAVRASDLTAAGWVIDPVTTEGELTWLRIHHDFGTVEEGNALLAQLSGPDGPYRDLSIARRSGLLSTTVEVTGEIDTSAGLAAFADKDLTQVLGGDPSGGLLARIEAEEKRPPAEMVAFDLTVDAAGTTRTFAADFTKSESHTFEVSDTDSKLLSVLGTAVVFLLAAATGVVLYLRWRERRFRSGRFMRSGARFR